MTDASTNLDTIKTQSQSQGLPEHWSLFLHCTICFGFFHNPHTLECGHSFCKRCLMRLAEIARDDNPDVRLRHLSVNCPTCRHPFRARPVIKGRIHTCIVIKHLVDLWKQECKILLSSSPRHLRSICSQTSTESTLDNDGGSGNDLGVKQNKENWSDNLQEEFLIRLPSADDYFEAVMKQVSEATEEIEQEQQRHDAAGTNKVGSLLQLATGADSDRRDAYNGSSDSESSVSSFSDDTGGGSLATTHSRSRGRGGGASPGTATGSVSSVSIPDIFGQMSLSWIVLHQSDSFPARFLLVAVWFVYSLLIVALAESFLPYVMLFTLFFFLIVLK